MKAALIMDIQSLPEGLDFEEFRKLWETSRVALWDSSNGGQHPFVISQEDIEPEIRDVNETNK